MNAIVGMVLLAISLVVSAAAQTTPDQTPPTSGSRDAPKAVDTAKTSEPAGSPSSNPAVTKTDADAQPRAQSAMENGVLVIRWYGVGPAAEDAESSLPAGQFGADRAISSALRVALDSYATPHPAVRSFRLRTRRIAEPWKYNPARGATSTQRARLWEYKPKRNWTYEPVPERSSAEVERLTRYRPTQP